MRRTSLASRIVLATVSVALLAALATAVVAFQLVRQIGVAQARDVLRSTIQVVASTPAAERATVVRNLDREHPHGVTLLLVRPDGSTVPTTGGATPVPSSAITRVVNTGTVSERVQVGGHTLLVEGRTISRSQAVIASQDFSLVQAANRRLLVRFAIAVALGVAVAVGVGILVARLVSRPLRRAAASARELAGGRRGVVAARRAAGDDETRIAEVADIEQALASLDAALALSEGRQHEFLLSVSHEIRTPLTAIRGYADALADGLVSPSSLPDVGRTLVAETARLEAFTSDLLELARLEADDFAIRPEPLDLVAVAVSSQKAWRARADGLGVAVTVHAPGPVPIVTDPMRVRQLLDGLLENALRASPEGSTITVTVTGPGSLSAGASGALEHAARRATIAVRDEGSGLTPADSRDAFERGVLRDRYRSTRAVGTGLGLSIAARLVRRLGGSIEAAPGDGGGAVFRVLLPPAAPAGTIE
ncbi:sensor histidine kinase [Frondihabitans australicus]|uniref:histidine kinase n=1 Tax=Frondihabitans australicus TaxID=386892 RepID=A0A495II85_9MICO|nr:HAMP domain-containing sensor histidine kinase [Frondihabitans australicus]RKR75011.1 two-component system sensor histidine kinase BaeS [Frondihabitans australicus]